MGTPITREGGYFVRLGQRAVGYRVDEVTYRKAEKFKIFGWVGLIVGIAFVIILGMGDFSFYQDLLIWQQVGILAFFTSAPIYMFFQMKWYFENKLARHETAVDDGMPLIEQRREVYQKMMPQQPWVLILLFAVGIPTSSSIGREGLGYFYVVFTFALTVEYVYFRFFHGKSKKTVDN